MKTEHTVPVPDHGTFLGHPKGLFVLFFAEMWERFCYYGMRGLLSLYIIKALFQTDTKAFAIYGAYTGLVYMAPVLGGWVADRILGYKWAVILGGILMAIGEFFILGGNLHWLYVGMAIIIVGIGAGGVVSDPELRADAVLTVARRAAELGWHAVDVTASPLPGPSGNVEYFLRLRTTTDQPLKDDALVAAVGRAVAEGPQ